jgi:hypothetical protein
MTYQVRWGYCEMDHEQSFMTFDEALLCYRKESSGPRCGYWSIGLYNLDRVDIDCPTGLTEDEEEARDSGGQNAT